MLAIARLGRQAGMRNVVVSAGFVNQETLAEFCAAVDAIKIDLKGYDEGFYRKVCGARAANGPAPPSAPSISRTCTWRSSTWSCPR